MTSTDERSPPHVASGTAAYVYGVTWSGGAGSLPEGVAGAGVETLDHGELAAVVSSLAGSDVRARRRDLLRHMEVLRSVFSRQAVLPLRFGTLLEDAEAVEGFLAARYEELVALLQELEGLAELRVHASYVQDAVLAEIVQDDPRIARLRERTRAAGPDADPLRVQLGETVA